MKLRSIVPLALCLTGAAFARALPEIQQPERGVARTSEPSQDGTGPVDAEKVLSKALELRARFTKEDLNGAIGMLHESSRLFRTSGNLRGVALAEIEIGDTFQMISQYPAALAAYRRALLVSDQQTDQRCEVYIRMARSYANTGQTDQARKSLDEASGPCGALGDMRLQADFEEAQGESMVMADNKPAAIPHLERAISLSISGKYHAGEALATFMLAAAEPFDASGSKKPENLAKAASTMFLENGDEYGAARAHSFQAFLSANAGNLERSRCYCQHALGFFERIGDSDNSAIALNELGQNAMLTGDHDLALIDYQRAKRLFSSVKDYIGEGVAISGIVDALLAEQRYLEITRLYSRKHELGMLAHDHSLIGSALMDQGAVEEHAEKYKEADAAYEKGIAEYRIDDNKSGEGVARMRQAGLEMNLGTLDQALVHLDQAQALKERTDEIADLARIRYLRARIFMKQNRLETARSEIEKTIAIIESQRLRITMFDSRAQYFSSVHEYYSLYIQVLMRLEKTHPSENYARLAFEASEKSKVRALLDLLGGSQQASTCDQLQASESIAESHESGSGAPSTLNVADTPALTLDAVRAEISDGDTVLLEFALDKDESFAWLIDGQNIAAIDLGPGEAIQARVRNFRRDLLPVEAHANESTIEYLRRRQAARSLLLLKSRRLGELLLGKINLPPRKRLLIVPDGSLQYLPFAALPIPDSGREGLPLITRYEVSMLPSASALVALRKSAAKRPPPTDELVIFGDPVFEQPGIVTPKANVASYGQRSRSLKLALQDSRGSQQIPSLPGSRSEALAIQQLFGLTRTRLALGFDANRDVIVGGSISHQRIIHFATHGIIDTRHPERSGIVLSMFNKRGEYQDGYLRLSDVYNLKLSADLVVLSSCESALGKDLGSEGIIGLPRGFLYAGARRVIASLWKVDDEATAVLMKSLYSRLERGEQPAQALHGAQLDLLKDKRLSDPYYWAAFVLEGEYQ